MIEREGEPVWTPLNPETGLPIRALMHHRYPLAISRIDYPNHKHHARWDAEAPAWVIAPPAPVEVTGVPTRWVVRDRKGFARYTAAEAKQAWRQADHYATVDPTLAPFSVEACVLVERPKDTR